MWQPSNRAFVNLSVADAETRFRSLVIGVTTRHASLLLRSRSLPVGESSALG